MTLASEKKPIDYLLADDRATLVWLANLAALELHTPLALAQTTERPTTLVFDLDPGPPASVIECCRVALALRGMFESLGLRSFAKTSGSKGLQLYVPLNSPDVSFAQTKPFAKAVAELLEEAEPELVVSRMTKARRTGRVLIDWSQNDSRKTTVCVYSLRARERPTVSTPVEWDEVRAALDSGDPGNAGLRGGRRARARARARRPVRARPVARPGAAGDLRARATPAPLRRSGRSADARRDPGRSGTRRRSEPPARAPRAPACPRRGRR